MGHQDLLSGKVAELSGEVSEWFKELVLKTSDSARGRGFESHPLRQRDGEMAEWLKARAC